MNVGLSAPASNVIQRDLVEGGVVDAAEVSEEGLGQSRDARNPVADLVTINFVHLPINFQKFWTLLAVIKIGFVAQLTAETTTIGSHFNRNNIESNLTVPGIQGCHANALYKSFETSPHLTCL